MLLVYGALFRLPQTGNLKVLDLNSRMGNRNYSTKVSQRLTSSIYYVML